MKLSDIINIYPALNALANVKLPAVASYRIGKAINKTKKIVSAFEAERSKLALALATEQPDPNVPGNTIYVFADLESRVKFEEQVKALLDEEEDIVLPTLTVAELGNISVEPAILSLLDGVVLFD